MTDEVLETAVRQLPPEVYSVTGGKITTLLKYRRDHLKKLARDFYLYHSAAISIQTTDKDEVVTLSFRDSGLVDVHIARSKILDLPYYRRRCKLYETGEIRIYLLGGDDEISLTGIAESSVIIRFIGGGGKGDDRIVKPSEKNRIFVYDTKNGMDVQAARTGSLRLKYEGDYYRVIPGAKMASNLEAAVPENKPNFFGFGNESDWDEEKEETTFIRHHKNICG